MAACRKKNDRLKLEKMLKLANNEIAKLQLYIYYFPPIRLPIIKWNTYTVGENVEKQALSYITHTSKKQYNIYRG